MDHLIRLHVCTLSRFSPDWLCKTPWTVARQAPLSMGFSRQECWSGLHALLQGIFPTQGKNPRLLHLLHCQAGSLPLVPPRKPLIRPLLGLKQCSDSSLKSNFLSLYSRPAPVVPELFQLSLTTLPSHPEPQSTHPACLLSPTVHQAFPSPWQSLDPFLFLKMRPSWNSSSLPLMMLESTPIYRMFSVCRMRYSSGR